MAIPVLLLGRAQTPAQKCQASAGTLSPLFGDYSSMFFWAEELLLTDTCSFPKLFSILRCHTPPVLSGKRVSGGKAARHHLRVADLHLPGLSPRNCCCLSSHSLYVCVEISVEHRLPKALKIKLIRCLSLQTDNSCCCF